MSTDFFNTLIAKQTPVTQEQARTIGSAEAGRLHRLAQIMGHDSLDTTMIYMQGTKQDLYYDVERIAWT